MGALRKLRRIGRNSGYAVEPLFPPDFEPIKPIRKMSEVLLDFADPLYDGSEDDTLFESIIGFAVICWNISLMDEKDHPGLMKRVVNDLVSDTKMPRFEAEDIVRMLIERKKTLFADDRRMIADFRVYKDKGQERIMVMSAMTKPRTASSQ